MNYVGMNVGSFIFMVLFVVVVFGGLLVFDMF